MAADAAALRKGGGRQHRVLDALRSRRLRAVLDAAASCGAATSPPEAAGSVDRGPRDAPTEDAADGLARATEASAAQRRGGARGSSRRPCRRARRADARACGRVRAGRRQAGQRAGRRARSFRRPRSAASANERSAFAGLSVDFAGATIAIGRGGAACHRRPARARVPTALRHAGASADRVPTTASSGSPRTAAARPALGGGRRGRTSSRRSDRVPGPGDAQVSSNSGSPARGRWPANPVRASRAVARGLHAARSGVIAISFAVAVGLARREGRRARRGSGLARSSGARGRDRRRFDARARDARQFPRAAPNGLHARPAFAPVGTQPGRRSSTKVMRARRALPPHPS